MNTTADQLLPLQINHLDLTMGATQILSNIRLSVEESGVTVILGHNGAGKSMLLKVLHGMVAPSAGTITWGQEEYPTEAIRHRQAMVFQKPVLLRRTVAANIQFALDLPHNTSTLTCSKLLDLTNLQTLANHQARTLSGGEQQRLAFARALACEPKVLFLDEPTANLDPDATLHIENLVDTAGKRDIKIFMVTHDIGQARRLAKEIIFLRDGAIEEHCSANEFFPYPKSTYCQSFIDGVLLANHP